MELRGFSFLHFQSMCMMLSALITFLLCHFYLLLLLFNCWLCFKSQLKWDFPLEDFYQFCKSLWVLKCIPMAQDLVLTCSLFSLACLLHKIMSFIRIQPHKCQRILFLPISVMVTKLACSNFPGRRGLQM